MPALPASTRIHGLLSAIAALVCAVLLLAAPSYAQDFPALTGRVVDAANILSPATETSLNQRLEQLETQSRRQLVVATVPDLGGNDVADYAYRLGRHWGIGDKDRNDGVVLLIAPNERRMNISVGYGLEPVLTDALSGRIIRDTITPRFKQQDFDGGVTAGVDAIIRQLTLPPEEARAIAQEASQQAEVDIPIGAIIFWLFFFFFILPILRAIFGSKKHSKRHRSHGGTGPIIIWGGDNHDWGSSSSSWGGGDFGGGGFSGGGGSFGGGGASGGW